MRKICYPSLFLIAILILPSTSYTNAASPTPDDDAWHPVESDEYSELWYFDAQFTNGYFFTGSITVSGNISNDAVVQVKFVISPPFKSSTIISESYSISDFQASQTECNVTVGNNRISGIWPYYSLYVTNGTVTVELSYVAKVEGWKPDFLMGDVWVVPVPRAAVNGQIQINGKLIKVEGEGYHDHIFKCRSFVGVYGWYWGRIFAGEYTIVWSQIMFSRGMPLTGFIMMASGDEVVGDTKEIQLFPRGYIYENTTKAYIPTIYKLRGGIQGLFFQDARLQLRMSLEEQGLLLALKDSVLSNNCTLYRLRVKVKGMVWMKSFPEKIETTSLMEVMRFQ